MPPPVPHLNVASPASVLSSSPGESMKLKSNRMSNSQNPCCCCSVLSHVQLFATPRTVARKAPLSMAFSWQEYWRGLPFPSPRDIPDPEVNPLSPALQADFSTTELPGTPMEHNI